MKVLSNANVLMTGCVSAIVHGTSAVVFVPVLSAIFLSHAGPLQRSTESFMVLAVMAPLAWAAVGFVFGGVMATIHNVFLNAFVAPQKQQQPVKEAAAVYAAGQHAA
jgi:hypothetical protein